MKLMRKFLAVAVLLCLPAAAFAAEARKGEWTGYITDTHCGKNGANKDHQANCVEKCMKGGSKPQILNEADQKLYNIEGFDKVKAHMGGRVTVSGSLNPDTNTITVESAAKAQ
jgi:hypothetical protein